MVDDFVDQVLTEGRLSSLSFDSTVSRHLVHRRSVHEVLLTDAARIDSGRYLIAAQLGRGNGLFGDRRCPYHDLLMAMEAGRQATVLVAHQFYAVPDDWSFVANRMSAQVTSLEACRDQGAPSNVVIDMRTMDTTFRGSQLSGMGFQLNVALDGVAAAKMGGALTFMPKDDYRNLREYLGARKPLYQGPVTHTRLPPARVGRYNERNVVIGEIDDSGPLDGDRYGLVLDENHPTLFDHQLDHVPGIYLLEVIRQAAISSAVRDTGATPEHINVMGCEVAFEDFAELGAGMECVVSTAGRDTEGHRVAEVGLKQGDSRLADAEITMSFS